MFTLLGQKRRLCDGLSRRQFVCAGSIAGGLLTLPDWLRLQAQAAPADRQAAPTPQRIKNKSVIMVTLIGGASHIDTYDPKPRAPAEYRGEFGTIGTRVPGVELTELFPLQAAMTDKLSIIRSLSSTSPNNHSDSELMTGRSEVTNSRFQHPCIGSIVSKLRERPDAVVPGYVNLRKMTFPTKTPLPQSLYYLNPGALGGGHAPFMPTGPDVENLTPSIDASRMQSRMELLSSFDQMRRDFDNSGRMEALDFFQRRAADILTSTQLRDALDLGKEDPRVVERYSLPDGPPNYLFATDYKMGTQLLLARRLVEAGVGFVEVALGYWDTHGPANVLGFPHLRNRLCPTLDRGLTALIEDLHQRGMQDDVIVVVWGEFGRSPKINPVAGRDHWLPAMSAVVAGGGLKMGQVIGATDARGETPVDKPYRMSNLLATIYHALGVDPARQFPDLNGRPQSILDDRQPIAELI